MKSRPSPYRTDTLGIAREHWDSDMVRTGCKRGNASLDVDRADPDLAQRAIGINPGIGKLDAVTD